MPWTRKRLLDHHELTDHERKNLAILEVIRRSGPVARADVSKKIDINIVTVTSYVDHFIKREILREVGVDVSSGGRKPALVDLNPLARMAVGVGLNTVDMIAVLTNLKGEIVHKVKRDRPMEPGPLLADKIFELVDRLIQDSRVDIGKVHGIGIGVPGIVNHDQNLIRWPGGLITKDLAIPMTVAEEIEDKVGVPVILENDANASCFGEIWCSDTAGIQNAVYLYSGSGIGIMIQGNIYRGSTGSAGEWVFNLESEDPEGWFAEACRSGAWVIDLGMTQRARAGLDQHKDSKLHALSRGRKEDLNFRMLAEAIREDDPFSIEILKDAAKMLGYKAAVLVNLFNPDAVIIGGGVEEAGVLFIDAVKERIKDIAIPEATERLKVMPSRLGEDAVPVGSADLVIQNFFIVGG